MAGTTKIARATGMADSTLNVTRLEYNKLVDDLETMRAAFATLVTKLNADTGVTDTNYASVAAASLLAAKVADQTGNTTS